MNQINKKDVIYFLENTLIQELEEVFLGERNGSRGYGKEKKKKEIESLAQNSYKSES